MPSQPSHQTAQTVQPIISPAHTHLNPGNFSNHWQNAQREAVTRLLAAMLREQLLTLLQEGNNALIPLTEQKSFLLIDKVELLSLTRYQLSGDVNLFTNEQLQPRLIQDPIELLKIIYPEISEKISEQRWQAFIKEIKNHTYNSALNQWHNTSEKEEIAKSAKKDNQNNLTEWLAYNLPCHQHNLFFEQFITQGHPHHPCSKTKLGMSHQDVLRYAPEFKQPVAIILAAIHRHILKITSDNQHLQYQQWFLQRFPKLIKQWEKALIQRQLNPDHFFPIPIHPWQAEHLIEHKFSDLMQMQQLILLDEMTFEAEPTLSFRTVVPTDPPNSPHIKLPVAVQSTSAVRTVSSASTENGPAFSAIMKKILKQENYFNHTLKIMSENFGLHVEKKDIDIDRSRHLSAIYRENPNYHIQDNQTAIVIAALFEKSPITQQPLLIELMKLAGVDSNQKAIQYFEQYSNIVLSSYLPLYLKYGIALEGHQQNTLAVFESGEVKMMIARDFGGMRLHLPSLLAKGYSFKPFKNSATICKNRAEACRKLLHSVYQYNLGECILTLSQYYHIDEKYFWNIIKKTTEKHFNLLQSEINNKDYESDYQQILKSPWPLKALMRMRLENRSHDYIYLEMENPISR